jgi:hypothetical protein
MAGLMGLQGAAGYIRITSRQVSYQRQCKQRRGCACLPWLAALLARALKKHQTCSSRGSLLPQQGQAQAQVLRAPEQSSSA